MQPSLAGDGLRVAAHLAAARHYVVCGPQRSVKQVSVEKGVKWGCDTCCSFEQGCYAPLRSGLVFAVLIQRARAARSSGGAKQSFGELRTVFPQAEILTSRRGEGGSVQLLCPFHDGLGEALHVRQSRALHTHAAPA